MVPADPPIPQNENLKLPVLTSLLTRLERDDLQALVLRLVDRDPTLIQVIANELTTLPISSGGQTADATGPPCSMDIASIRKSVQTAIQSALRSVEDSFDDYDGVYEIEKQLKPWLEGIRSHILAGDARGVFPALTALTEELLDGWEEIKDYCSDMSDLFTDVGKALAEALLSSELTVDERDAWVVRLGAWQARGASSGAIEGMAVAIEAADRGWDDPLLLRVLQGEITERGVWNGTPPACATMLASVRLDIMERKGLLQEAIYLANAEGQTERYLDLLIKAGRPQEALDTGLKLISSAGQALRVAQSLVGCGESDMALTIAERGLSFHRQVDEDYEFYHYDSPVKHLADWLRDQALLRGRVDLAIRAAVVGLKEEPLLEDYLVLKEIAGEQWAHLQQEILDFLCDYNGSASEGIIDILLLEGRRDHAMRLTEESHNYDLVQRVLDACLSTHSDQVIAIAKKHAERIMESGKSQRYHHAADWLKRVRDGYRASERTSEWTTYRASLLATHGRKYTLVPMIKAL